MDRHIVIVGAGPGGLAAAMLLSHAGYRVTVLEAKGQIGGRTSAIEHDGFRFDIGPTFFLYPRVLEDIFATVGRDLWKEVPMVRLDPQYRLVFGSGGQIDATPNVERMAAELAKLQADDARNLQRFLDENRGKLARFRPILEMPFLSWTDLLRWPVLQALPLLRPWNSLDADLKRYFSDPRIRLAMSFQSKYLGMSPFQCPSLFTILSFLEYEHGVWHPLGGCAAVTARMADLATELGAEISLNEPATGLDFRGRCVVGVRTPSRTISCDALVINADFAGAMQRLVPDHLRRRWTNRKLAEKRFSCSTFMMYLGVEGRFDHVAHHTIYLSKEYERNLRDIESDHRLSEDPSFYVQNPCVTDPSLAPPGCSGLYVLAPVTHQHPHVNWTAEEGRFRDLILDRLDRVGITDVRQRIRFEKRITPADWERDFWLYRGATFNLAHNLGQMLLWRPRNRFEDLEGVYLVGGGTHPGSGLPVIFESARITSRLIQTDLAGSEPTHKNDLVSASAEPRN